MQSLGQTVGLDGMPETNYLILLSNISDTFFHHLILIRLCIVLSEVCPGQTLLSGSIKLYISFWVH